MKSVYVAFRFVREKSGALVWAYRRMYVVTKEELTAIALRGDTLDVDWVLVDGNPYHYVSDKGFWVAVEVETMEVGDTIDEVDALVAEHPKGLRHYELGTRFYADR